MNDDNKFEVAIIAKFVADKAMAGLRFFVKKATQAKDFVAKQWNSTEYYKKPLKTIGSAIKEWAEDSDEFDGSMKRSWKTAKRLALSLFGVTTIWRGIIKAVNTYMSVNTDLQARVNGLYYAIGSLFAPALEFILKLLSSFVLYIDAFARGLGFAGVNMANLSKSAKKTAKQLAGFDEINNLTSDSGSSPSIVNPLSGVSLGGWDEKIFLVGKWFKENLPIWGTLFGLLAGSIFGAKLKLGEFVNEQIGLGTVIVGIIGLVQTIITFIKDPSWEHFGMVLTSLSVIVIGLGIATGGLKGILIAVAGVALSYIAKILVEGGSLKDAFMKALNAMVNTAKTAINAIGSVFKWLLSFAKSIFDGLVTVFVTWWKFLGQMLVDIFNAVVNVGKKINDFITGLFKGIVNFVIMQINIAIDSINRIFHIKTPRLKLFGQVIEAVDIRLINIPKIPLLATGTNYVPNDQLAMIHQGEAVVPKKFNSSEYFKNDETNALLQTLIDRVDAIELNPYVTVTDVGKASVKYINQQARIKGGSVI